MVVRFSEGVSLSVARAIASDAGARVARGISLPRTRVLRVRPGTTTTEAIAELNRDPAVDWAEPNFVRRLSEISDDPLLSEQWGLHNVGQLVGGFAAGTADADVDAPEAWDVTVGDSLVTVAVVDSGIAFAHADLAPQLVGNPGESGSGRESNGADDDGNGFIDDFQGWDFRDADNDPTDPSVDLGHGSLVASLIGAQGDDTSGVTGVGQRVGILPLRVAGTDGTLTSVDAADAFAYAASMGAHIVNGSFGGPGLSNVERTAIEGAPGTLFVVSSGNDGIDVDASPVSPCALDLPNVLCVGATDQSDDLADFSNFGAATVDLAAPGVGMLGAQQPYADSFSEGFETTLAAWITAGTGGPWEQTTAVEHAGSTSLTDSDGVDYGNDEDHSIRTASAVNLQGKERCRMRYFMRLEAEGGPDDFFDGVVVEAATNSAGPWTELNRYAGTTSERFFSFTEDLTSFSGQANVFVRFRFVSDDSVTFDGAYIDDVAIQCASSTTGTRDFAYGDGTSFSAPLVAGIGALVRSAAPELSSTDVRSALLAGVDRVPALVGTTATGGRSNAVKALLAIPPGTTTSPPGNVEGSTASLPGTVRPHGQPTTFHFDYGLTSAYGQSSTEQSAGNGLGDQPVELALSQVPAGVTVHYRLVATNQGGVVAGQDRTFQTPGMASPLCMAPPARLASRRAERHLSGMAGLAVPLAEGAPVAALQGGAGSPSPGYEQPSTPATATPAASVLPKPACSGSNCQSKKIGPEDAKLSAPQGRNNPNVFGFDANQRSEMFKYSEEILAYSEGYAESAKAFGGAILTGVGAGSTISTGGLQPRGPTGFIKNPLHKAVQKVVIIPSTVGLVAASGASFVTAGIAGTIKFAAQPPKEFGPKLRARAAASTPKLPRLPRFRKGRHMSRKAAASANAVIRNLAGQIAYNRSLRRAISDAQTQFESGQLARAQTSIADARVYAGRLADLLSAAPGLRRQLTRRLSFRDFRATPKVFRRAAKKPLPRVARQLMRALGLPRTFFRFSRRARPKKAVVVRPKKLLLNPRQAATERGLANTLRQFGGLPALCG